jgi:hypothetical protein
MCGSAQEGQSPRSPSNVLQRYTERMSQLGRPPVLEKYQAQRESFERQLVSGRSQATSGNTPRATEASSSGPSRSALAPVIARYNQVCPLRWRHQGVLISTLHCGWDHVLEPICSFLLDNGEEDLSQPRSCSDL